MSRCAAIAALCGWKVMTCSNCKYLRPHKRQLEWKHTGSSVSWKYWSKPSILGPSCLKHHC